MHRHHEESIRNMTAHYRADPDITALFLIGSVATGTERPDSDLDGVAVITPEAYERRKNGHLEESVHGKCTYEGGYFDIHYMTRENLEQIAVNGSEPMRNMFSCAKTLFCDQPGLPELVARIPVYPKEEAGAKLLRFYCTFKMYRTYFWVCCKPEGFARMHAAHGMIYCLYRLILIENEMLFPSTRRLEEFVARAPKKPERIVDICRRFAQSLSEGDCLALVETYEAWTSYDFPKDEHIIVNNFSNPYEWN